MNKFQFNPPNGLLDANIYPTNPSTEAEARGQIQAPLNQLKEYLNLFLDSFIINKNANGYTKLPNDVLIQWGTFLTTGINANSDINATITLPLAFGTKIAMVIPFVRKAINADTTTVVAEVIVKQVTIYTNSSFAVRLGTKEYVSGGVEVGYLAIGY